MNEHTKDILHGIASLIVIVMLLFVGHQARDFRDETRTALEYLKQQRAAQTLTTSWTIPSGEDHLQSVIEPGETFSEFLTRHRLCVQEARK